MISFILDLLEILLNFFLIKHNCEMFIVLVARGAPNLTVFVSEMQILPEECLSLY